LPISDFDEARPAAVKAGEPDADKLTARDNRRAMHMLESAAIVALLVERARKKVRVKTQCDEVASKVRRVTCDMIVARQCCSATNRSQSDSQKPLIAGGIC
jgi:hypothetical protein